MLPTTINHAINPKKKKKKKKKKKIGFRIQPPINLPTTINHAINPKNKTTFRISDSTAD